MAGMDRELEHIEPKAEARPGFGDKRHALLNEAARLYAKHGTAAFSLDRLSVQLGHAHNYHTRYFQTKEQLVYALLNEHIDGLLKAMDPADEAPDARGRLHALAALYLGYALGEGADAQRAFRQVLPWLAAERRPAIDTKQRWLLALFEDAVATAMPELAAAPHLVAPLALSLFALLNGAVDWLDPRPKRGPDDQPLRRLSVAEYAALAVDCVLAGGAAALATP